MKKYPFKFLDSYEREDRGIFFGRDEEINALYEMVFQSSVMLVYGASGTGKTSLINCGLAGKFQPHDWLALMIRRGNNINDSLKKALDDSGGNMATVEVDTDWHDKWSDESETTAVILNPVERSIKAVYQKSFRPVYLIFDQFEELFILGSVKEQERFIKTVKDILQSDQPVKLIFCIREEYLGYLFEFERAVPQLLRKKLRVEPMNLEKVKQVIIGAAEYEDSNIRLKPGESEQIAENIFNKIRGKGKSLTIQLPFLQVFLDKFYMKVTGDENREANAEFSLQKLNDMGEIGDVLINFLEEQVAGISKNLKDKYPALTPETTWKILSPFSTLEGTKEPISKKDLYDRLQDHDTATIDDVVDAFTRSRIIRYNEATDMFEIAHDSLAKPIADKRSVEETALLEIKRLIKSQVAVKEEAREYFTEKQLLFIEPYLDKFKQNDEEQVWINKSRAFIEEQKEAAQKQQQEKLLQEQRLTLTKKRVRILYGLLSAAFLALIFAAYFWFNAIKQTKIAKKQTDIANAAKKVSDSTLAVLQEIEFRSLESRANIILQASGCAGEIANKMDSIYKIHKSFGHPDEMQQWGKIIDSIDIMDGNCDDFADGVRSYSDAINKGDMAYHEGQFSTAINMYFAAEAFDPNKKDIVKNKIDILFNTIDDLKRKALDEAMNAFNEAVRANSARAVALESNAEAQKARQMADSLRMIAIEDRDKYYNNMSDALTKLGRVSDLIDSIIIKTDEPTAGFNLKDSLLSIQQIVKVGHTNVSINSLDTISNFIAKFEGVYTKFYRDQNGHKFIGIEFDLESQYSQQRLELVGADYQQILNGASLSQDQILKLFKSDLKLVIQSVNTILPEFNKLSVYKQTAIISFIYNMGINIFQRSSLCKKINANPDDPSIRDEFMKWTKAGMTEIPGLVNRRRTEADYYFKK